VATTSTDADFERLTWHDCTIWGLELHPPDPDAGDWACDLVLDIDFIVEWLCDVGGRGCAQFRVAPATLRFHTVADLRIAITWGGPGVLLHEAAIDRIERDWPPAGEIAFTASGFTQTLRAEPVVTGRQSLPRRGRSRPE
jgi:hypothetical protein